MVRQVNGSTPPPAQEPVSPQPQLKNVYTRIEGRDIKIIDYKENLNFKDKLSHFIEMVISLFSINKPDISFKYGDEAKLFWTQRFTEELKEKPSKGSELKEKYIKLVPPEILHLFKDQVHISQGQEYTDLTHDNPIIYQPPPSPEPQLAATPPKKSITPVPLSDEMLKEIDAQSKLLSGVIHPPHKEGIIVFLTTVKSNFQAIKADLSISPEKREVLKADLKKKLPEIQKELITGKLSDEEDAFVQSLLNDIVKSFEEAKPISPEDYESL